MFQGHPEERGIKCLLKPIQTGQQTITITDEDMFVSYCALCFRAYGEVPFPDSGNHALKPGDSRAYIATDQGHR